MGSGPRAPQAETTRTIIVERSQLWLLGIEVSSITLGLEAVKTAASDAGRNPASITPALSIYIATGRSRDDVDGC